MNDNGIKFTDFEENQDKDFYFSAPAKFKGNRLASYGGNITFKIMFEGSSGSSSRKKLELRIAGSQINIYHNFAQNIYPYEEYKIVVPLYETDFKRYGDNVPVDREHMLMALSNIDKILIRAKIYDEQYAVK